jgi:alpha-1,2-glucosyltransferase
MRVFFMFFAIFGFLLLFFLRIQDQQLYVDEGNHLNQIQRFVRGDTSMNQILLMIPGYHLMVAGVVWVFKITRQEDVRGVAFIINCIAIIAAYLVSHTFDKKGSILKTIQFVFLPIIFPYYFLIYTDIVSLVCILFAYYFVSRKKYFFSGLFASLSIFIRQNNIVWLFMLYFLLYVSIYGFTSSRRAILTHVVKGFMYYFGIIGLIIYMAVQKGISSGLFANELLGISWSLLGNIYFFLFVYAVLFFPRFIFSFRSIIVLILRKKWILLGIALFFVVFLLTFKNDHPYNHTIWFIRNRLLEYFSYSLWNKTMFFLGVIIGVFTLLRTPLMHKKAYIIYPFSFLYLLPLWLIELRYYFIPFTLILLLSKRSRNKVEYIQLVYMIIMSIVVFEGILRLEFFL